MFSAGEWLSIAVLGLVILFISMSIAFFVFLIGPDGIGPTTTVEPSSAYFQVIFISIAPAVGLSFFANVLSEGSRLSALLIIVSGISLIFGMLYVSTLIPQIDDIELPMWLVNVPWIFSIFGILFLVIGCISYRKRVYRSPNKYEI